MAAVTPLNERQWAFLADVARDLVPETAGLDAAGWARFREIVAHALALRPPAVRRQFATFLSLVRLAPALRFGAPFDRLPAERRARVLRWLHDCPLALLRKGFWGLKALAFMGYYAQVETAPAIHYTPSFDGNARLHD